ncbi:MAG TPA: two-component system response regulator [Syntrophales bacterium]|nr:two-component system response regulator [Syntrophales bacterium]
MTVLKADDQRKSILIVDNALDDIDFMSSILKDIYRIELATNMEKTLQITFSEDPPDLILINIMMPEKVGYHMCRYFKSIPETSDIPVIFLSSKSDEEEEKMGFELGAVDYITKPVSPSVFLARINTHLQLKSARDFLKDKAEYLEQEVARRTKEISMIQDVTMVTMGSLAETRDNETANHIRRTQNYVKLLATKLKAHPKFKNFLTDEKIMLLFKSAPLHDMGKVGIPDHILLKPGELTPEEFEIMKTHTTIGRDAIISAENLLGIPVPFLRVGMEIAYGHHEKWNGAGYPEGLSGDDISIPGRLMAIADVYDALISRRIYKPPYPHEESVDIIREASGTHFDPDIVDAFLVLANQFNKIAQKYADSEEDVQKKWPLK